MTTQIILRKLRLKKGGYCVVRNGGGEGTLAVFGNMVWAHWPFFGGAGWPPPPPTTAILSTLDYLCSFIAKAEFAAAVVLPLVHGVGGAVQETKARPHIKDMKGQSQDFGEYSIIQGYFLYTHSNIVLLLIYWKQIPLDFTMLPIPSTF